MQHDHILKKNHFWPQPNPHAKIKQEAINKSLGIQLLVSQSLALEDMGDQGSLGVSVLKRMSMCAT